MAEDTGGEKTLPASPMKLQRARDDGNIARSQDLSSAMALTVALAALVLLSSLQLQRILELGRFYIGGADLLALDHTPISALAWRALYDLAVCVGPFMAAMLLSGIVLNYFQVGVLFTTKPLQPKFDRLNPISGMQRFISIRTFAELIKSLAKLAVITLLAWLAVHNRIEEFVALMGMTPLSLLPAVGDLVFTIWWRVAAAMIVIGLADLAFQRWQHGRDLRMTQQEARQETRELEGNPQIKRRVRQIQRQLATQRMMAEVPRADVIITNPTHYAVALLYDASRMQAPVVLAKGERLIAQRIRELGVEHRVPIIEKPQLARTLFRSVEVNMSIPENLFRAVAEILSFVYRIDQRAEKRREREKIWQGRRVAV